MPTTVIDQAIALFIVINAVGQIPLFLGLLSPFSLKRQRIILLREMLIALLLMLSFAYFGEIILHLLGVTKPILGIAGGILLFLVSLTMIFPKDTEEKSKSMQEPIFVPLAMPATAGPGALTSVMFYASTAPSAFTTVYAILLAWIPSLVILYCSSYLQSFFGQKGLAALQKLGGMIFCLISLNMIATGIITFIKDNFPLFE
jgi:multiple antibiotic resistance protein